MLGSCQKRIIEGLLGESEAEIEEPKVVAATEQDLKYLEWIQPTLQKGWTVDAEHLRLIGEHLDAVTRGEIDRLAIFMPPRHAKTETVTIRYPVKCLEEDPESWFLVTGYNERFARRLGRKTRAVAQQILRLAGDKQASDEWATLQGGGVMARGVGSPPMGVGFKGICIDDPIRRREDAESEVYREKTWDWYADDLYTRLEPGGWIILTVTRWHEDDVAARAIKSEPGRWVILNLPALAEEGDILGRKPGQALWPARFDTKALERIRDVMTRDEGLRNWEALYQQNPTPREGSLFHVSKIEVVEVVPAGLQKVRWWDLGGGGRKSDWTVGVLIAGPDKDGLYYILDVVRGQWEIAERDRIIRNTAAEDGKGVRVRVPQDPGAAGKQVAQYFIRLLAGYPIAAVKESGDKVFRAEPLAAQVNAGNLRLKKAPWNREYVEQLRQAPHGKSKDTMDASSGGHGELVKLRKTKSAVGGSRPAVTALRNVGGVRPAVAALRSR